MSEATDGRKLGVIGAGDVGATVAYAALLGGVVDSVALYDTDEKKATAQAADLRHGLPFCPANASGVEGNDDPAVLNGCGVVVLTAGARQREGESRGELASRNVAIFRELVPRVAQAAPGAFLLVVTNPVDLMTLATLTFSGLSRDRVLGSGTVLDSARLRTLLAEKLKVSPADVLAHVAGEHGDAALPLWSTASVSGVPLRDWAVMGHGRLDVRSRAGMTQDMRESAAAIIAGKGATNFAVGLACREVISALAGDVPRVLSVGGLIEAGDGFEGLEGACLSLPRPVSSKGVEPPLPTPLSDNELAGLRQSAESQREAARSAGL